MSQGRLTLGKVIVQKRQLMATFDDAEEWSKDHNTATLEEIQYPNTNDLE